MPVSGRSKPGPTGCCIPLVAIMDDAPSALAISTPVMPPPPSLPPLPPEPTAALSAGDLYVELSVDADDELSRDGRTINSTVGAGHSAKGLWLGCRTQMDGSSGNYSANEHTCHARHRGWAYKCRPMNWGAVSPQCVRRVHTEHMQSNCLSQKNNEYLRVDRLKPTWSTPPRFSVVHPFWVIYAAGCGFYLLALRYCRSDMCCAQLS